MTKHTVAAPDQKASVASQCATPIQASHSGQSQPDYSSGKAAILFGCYRKSDANDPEIYVAAVTAILSEYPPEIVDHVCDPRTGLPRRLKWLPTVAEIADACDERLAHAKAVESLRDRAEKYRAVISDPHAGETAKAEAQGWLDLITPRLRGAS